MAWTQYPLGSIILLDELSVQDHTTSMTISVIFAKQTNDHGLKASQYGDWRKTPGRAAAVDCASKILKD